MTRVGLESTQKCAVAWIIAQNKKKPGASAPGFVRVTRTEGFGGCRSGSFDPDYGRWN